MNKSSKPRKTASKRTPKATVPENLPESNVSAQLAPEPPPESEVRPLTINIDSPPPGHTFTGEGQVAITVSGSVMWPSRSVDRAVVVTMGGGSGYDAAITGGHWSLTGVVRQSSESLVIAVIASAASGFGEPIQYEGNDQVTVKVEIQKPPTPPPPEKKRPEVQILAPAGNSEVPAGGTVDVTVDVKDPSGSNLYAIRWYVDGVEKRVDTFSPAVNTWRGTKTLEIPYRENPRSHTILVRASNQNGDTAVSRTVIYNDANAPTVRLLYPKNNAKVSIGSTVIVRGWAEDRQSGVDKDKIQWWFDGSGPSLAASTPDPLDSRRVNWSLKIENFPAGSHVLKLHVTDKAAHEATTEIRLIGATPYKPRDVNDLVSLRAYLEDLVDHAKAHVNTLSRETGSLDPKTQLTEGDLAEVFYQPFEQLIDGRLTFGDRPVNQLRAAIEVLRKHVAPVSARGDGAQFLSQSVPSKLQPGQAASVSITMKNIGITTWTALAGYALGTEDRRPIWGTNRVLLSPSDAIQPGESKTFEFEITAPETPGIYNFEWRMMRGEMAGFGGYTSNVVVTVLESPAPLLSPPTEPQAPMATFLSTRAAELPSQPRAAAAGTNPCDTNNEESHPWINWISPPQDYAIQSPNEVGYLTVKYTVDRSNAGCPLGRIEWSDRTTGQVFPNVPLPNVESWTNTQTFTIPYDTRQEHILDMTVRNKTAGNRHTELRFTFVDGTAPELKIVSPQNNEKVPTKEPVVVRGSAEDHQSRVDRIEWKLDAGSFQSASFSPDPENVYLVNWSFQIPDLTEGPHRLALSCVDKKGNATAAEITIIGDPVVPRPSVTITDPLDGTEIGGTSEMAIVEVSGQAITSEPGNPQALIDAIEWYVDDQEVDIDPVAPPQGTVEFTKRAIQIPYALQKEQRKLTVFARTVSGVKGEGSITLGYFDKTPPEFAVVSPKNDARVPVGTPLVLRGWAKDRQSGVDKIEWSLDGSSEWNSIHPSDILPDLRDSYRVTWQFMTYLTFGEHSIRVRVCDKKGNCTPDDAALIKVVAVATVTEADYRLAVYQALLNRIGTSYEELRLARGAEEKTRLALASRLGFNVAHLDGLLLLPAEITEARLEQLFGYADTARDPQTSPAVPLLLQWRQEYLEALWLEQDWPNDPYSLGQLPVIDPDLIGPDDLRQPIEGQAPFETWKKRREWVDARLQEFAGMKKTVNNEAVPDLAAMFARMYQPLPDPNPDIRAWKDNTPPSTFDDLRDQATQDSDAEVRQIAIEQIQNDLNLTVESFSRLLTVRDQDVMAASDPRNAKVSAEEWQEVYSILAQAQKTAIFPVWIAEENAKGVLLDPMQFWISLREPQEGDWPPALPPNQPLIDPDVLELIDLPEPTLGKPAIELWEARRLRLEEIGQLLKAEREANGFEAMLKLALGHPSPGAYLDALNDDLHGVDQKRHDDALKAITGDLHMTINAFATLMEVKRKDAEGDPLKKPTAMEYAEAYAILTQTSKFKLEYPKWIEAELGLEYWRARKARLPRWRASAEARQGWQQALRIRSSAPLIDPDLIGEEDLDPRVPNPAFDLWGARQGWLTAEFEALQDQRPDPAEALSRFETVVSETLGRPVAELLALETKQKEGIDIEPELGQLFLTRRSFARLLRLRRMAENQTLSEPEWDDVCHILAQVLKQQRYQLWRTAEMEQQITLTPKFFQISEADPILPLWRATLRARLNWQDILQARIDQWQALEDGLAAAVAAVEEQTLVLLRDALVLDEAGRRGASASELADWFTRVLVVDVKTNGSQRTTRSQQAIETMQGLLFGLRTGAFDEDHSSTQRELPIPPRTNQFDTITISGPEPPPAPGWASWELAYLEGSEVKLCEDDHFDGEWEWLGNYAAWRGALLIYYFPEHLLLPTLRPTEEDEPDHLRPTKHFQSFVQEVRKKSRLTPDGARAAASFYLDGLLKDPDIILPENLKKIIHVNFITDQQTDQTLVDLRTLCKEVFEQYTEQAVPSQIQEVFYFVPLHLALQLQKSGAYLAALDWYQTIYAFNLADKPETEFDERKIYRGLELENNQAPLLARHDHWLLDWLNPHTLAATRNTFNSYTRYTLMSVARCFMEFADAEFTLDTAESLARARGLYLTAQALLHVRDFNPPDIPPDLPDATIFPNPLLELLRLRVEIQLTKMRWGLNIAGMKRQLDLLAPQAINSLPVIGPGGQIIIPDGQRRRPTPYYFRVLMERSKQIVNIAQQIEAAYLAALEKQDAENYNLLKASHDLQLAHAGEELQGRRVNEATLGVEVARRQQQRARVVKEQYTALSNLPLNEFEQQMVGYYQDAISHFNKAGGASGRAAWAQGAGGVASAGAGMAGLAMVAGALGPVGWAGIAAYGVGALIGLFGANASAQVAKETALGHAAQADASIAGIKASHEWRKKEWELQAVFAEQDILIGEAQVNVAQAHVGVSQQELKIARTQVTQAQAVAEFLARKFTNAELYEWMSDVLGEVYNFFLQQATATAQLAESQLAFERQDRPPRFIQADYWEVPADTSSLTSAEEKAPDRKGLTGSARLLQDIYQLDQYAFETDKRKLNLSQTFSLSRLAPLEFEQFRQTGVLTFATPMEFFDREFPGHHLRLIKRVRTSVVALIPPHQGIRATLTASGISRVVTSSADTLAFQEVAVRRDPELVGLSSPMGATGVFEMDVQSEMLLPFESMGVDTFWEFEMPRAANPFDFRTIADVLVTIEYTALNSFDYRQQVLKRLDPQLSGERPFSFVNQFADAWYDLHNPEQSGTPMIVKFKTAREDFPPNLDDLRIEHVLLFFSRAVDEFGGEELFEVEVENLRFTPLGQKNAIGGGGMTIDGVISTRRGNGASWNIMIGKSPVGEWELELPDTAEVKGWFKDEKIDDILFVITYGGRTPAWPA